MNAQEHIRLLARVAALEEQVNALTAMLLPADDAPVAEAKVEGEEPPAEEEVEPRSMETRARPMFEGIDDKGGGWFDVYWGGKKLNTKAVRRDQANSLLDNHRQMQARPVLSDLDGDPGSAGVDA